MNKLHTMPRIAFKQAGLSLVEIMVGVLIGMIGMVVIFQVLSVSEDRKRTSTGGVDAQVAGSISLYAMDRDLRLAGYGFGTAAAQQMGCVVQAYDKDRPGQNFSFVLGPVVIEQINGAAGPDRITVLYGSSNFMVTDRPFTASTAGTKVTQTGGRPGFMRGDLAIAATNVTPSNCAMVEITDNTNIDTVTIAHADSGSYTSDYAPPTATPVPVRFNRPGGPSVAFSQGYLFNLGPNPRRNVWSVSNGRLTVADDLHSDVLPLEIADSVVNMKAEYGIDANGDNLIANSEWTTTTPTTAAGWRSIRAVRVALLTRSAQWDKNHCNLNPQWSSGASGTPTLTNFTMSNVDGTADTYNACAPGTAPADAAPNNWRNYRYRIYETVIPLRNMIWGTAP